MNKSENLKTLRLLAAVGLLIAFGFFLSSFRTVLNGPHEHRQADSVFSGYFYCMEEDSQFLRPKIAPRGATDGVAINEFPIYAFVLGKVCQLKGGWDEVTPRVVSLLFAILSGILFWKSLLKKYELNGDVDGQGWLEFLAIYLLLPVTWTFFSIPMPESTALFFYSIAAYLWTGFPKKKSIFALGGIFFAIGFLIRPFYILFLFFFVPNFLLSGIVLAVCIFLFWFWYRYWDSMVTTTPGYFGIRLQSTQEILQSVPHALSMLPSRILGHTAIVGLLSFYLIRKKYFQVVLFYVAAIGMMYVLKPTHVGAHAYYLMNAGLFSAFAIFLSFGLMTEKQKIASLIVLLLVTFSSTQHNFHRNGNWERTQSALKEFGELPQEAVVATYLGGNPQWLYYLKRTGYIFEPADFKGQCPPNATHYLISGNSIDDGQAKLSLMKCSP